jgi:acyl-CoA synthetase (AMP-forming)/AMP-acid ligase II
MIEANTAAFKNGWFRTGDIGYMDREGFLFIKGRLKDIINRGGEKVAPREVEEVLLTHPAVKEAVVFSMKHPKLGEDIAAAIVLKEGRKASEGELRVYVSEKLTFYKVPTRLFLVGEIPKGVSGKISRTGMAESLGLTKGAMEKAEYVPPRTETEERLVKLLEEIFPNPKSLLEAGELRELRQLQRSSCKLRN